MCMSPSAVYIGKRSLKAGEHGRLGHHCLSLKIGYNCLVADTCHVPSAGSASIRSCSSLGGWRSAQRATPDAIASAAKPFQKWHINCAGQVAASRFPPRHLWSTAACQLSFSHALQPAHVCSRLPLLPEQLDGARQRHAPQPEAPCRHMCSHADCSGSATAADGGHAAAGPGHSCARAVPDR